MAKALKTKMTSKPFLAPKSTAYEIKTNHTLMLSHKVYGDYPEILMEYYKSQIAELTNAMNSLTIYEDAFEIRATCQKIMVIRNKMQNLRLRFPV